MFNIAPKYHGPVNYGMGILCYLGILCLVPLVTRRHDEFIDFHSRQGTMVWLFFMMGMFSLYLPVVGGFIFGTTYVSGMIFSGLGILSVLTGRMLRIPGFYHIAARFA
ncbi:MAG: hypothetical protein HQL53_03165 [Magnetococcales bacterium]|nr:hypothetical protein [Magnetococcales bacterium]